MWILEFLVALIVPFAFAFAMVLPSLATGSAEPVTATRAVSPSS